MLKTEHYQLNKPEVTDPLRLEDFNENVDLIDAALKSQADSLAAVNTALGTKAEQSTVAALQSAVNGKGNCKIAMGSYTGTGTYGSAKPTSLTFPFAPTVVMIAESGDGTSTEPVRMNTSFLVNPLQGATSTYDKALRVTWSGSSVSWYCDDDVVNPHLAQNNRSGYIYYWVAFRM